MRIRSIAIALLFGILSQTAARAEEPSLNTKTSTVFIANYDANDSFIGWGSGFFVDEGIVVTNKHVIDAGMSYRVFATGENAEVDLQCYRDLTRSDVKINLDDDVAYMRVFLDCPHGAVFFADADPRTGDAIGVMGYPYKSTMAETLHLTIVGGTVTGGTDGAWLQTDAFLDFGNSGGPVVQGDRVVGVAVAKSVDQDGKYLSGLFVPVSVILHGLEYANTSTFGYTPQTQQKNPIYPSPESEMNRRRREAADPFDPAPAAGEIASNSDCRSSLGDGGEATGFSGCRCKQNYHPDDAKTTCLPGVSPAPPPPPSPSPFAASLLPFQSSFSSSQRSSPAQPQSLLQRSFPDVRSTSYAYPAIRALRESGVIVGYPDGTFRPGNTVNRAELLKILMEGYHADALKAERN